MKLTKKLGSISIGVISTPIPNSMTTMNKVMAGLPIHAVIADTNRKKQNAANDTKNATNR